jgi:hypothetical protein
MSNSNAIPWKRLTIEGAAIVLSILLAFWIDAWWQQKMALAEADALISGLHSDFQESQSHLEEWLAGNERTLRATTKFLDQLRGAAINDEVLVSHEWLLGAIVAPTYSPTDTSLKTAIATGKIELIDDSELRNALAIWRQQIDDTLEDELLIREVVVNQLVPVLSQQVRLGASFEYKTMFNWFTARQSVDLDGQYKVRVTAELEGVLAEKVFYTTFVVEGLAAIHRTQAEILRLLEENSEDS